MNIVHVIILGIVEGLTEFLPISSTGHMILATKILNIPTTEFVKSFEIAIQLGAILAGLTLYTKKLLTERTLWKPLIVAFVPTMMIGLAAYPIIKRVLLDNSLVVVISLFVGGVVLIVVDKILKTSKNEASSQSTLTIKNAAIIGLAQGISVIPGVSRAAATIVGGMSVGLSRKDAVEFSFLLAIPTIGAATILDLVKTGWHFTSEEFGLMGIGALVSWIVALLTMKTLLKLTNKSTLAAFGMYRIIIAILFYLLVK